MYTLSDIFRMLQYMATGGYHVYYDTNMDGVLDRLDLSAIANVVLFATMGWG